VVRLEAPISDALLDALADRVTRRLCELPVPEAHYVSQTVWSLARLRGNQPPTAAQV